MKVTSLLLAAAILAGCIFSGAAAPVYAAAGQEDDGSPASVLTDNQTTEPVTSTEPPPPPPPPPPAPSSVITVQTGTDPVADNATTTLAPPEPSLSAATPPPPSFPTPVPTDNGSALPPPFPMPSDNHTSFPPPFPPPPGGRPLPPNPWQQPYQPYYPYNRYYPYSYNPGYTYLIYNPEILSFYASPTSILEGQTTTLTWAVSNAEAVTITPAVGRVPATGSVVVRPGETTTYTLVAYNIEGRIIAGNMVTASATVQVEPLIVNVYPLVSAPVVKLFTASLNYLQSGQATVLSWDVQGADTVNISPDVGTVAGTGSLDITPADTTIYSLIASNSAGSADATTTVYVARTEAFTSSLAYVPGSIDGTGDEGGTTPASMQTGDARSTGSDAWLTYLLLGLVAAASVIIVALLVRKPVTGTAFTGGTSAGRAVSTVGVAASQPATQIPATSPVISALAASFISSSGTPMPIMDRAMGRRDFQELAPPDLAGTISREHIRITFEDSLYYIEDTDSTNGTRLNGSEIRGSGRHIIADGDSVELARALKLTFNI